MNPGTMEFTKQPKTKKKKAKFLFANNCVKCEMFTF